MYRSMLYTNFPFHSTQNQIRPTKKTQFDFSPNNLTDFPHTIPVDSANRTNCNQRTNCTREKSVVVKCFFLTTNLTKNTQRPELRWKYIYTQKQAKTARRMILLDDETDDQRRRVRFTKCRTTTQRQANKIHQEKCVQTKRIVRSEFGFLFARLETV